jgi:non-homologous end joining protein Ku
MEYFDKLKEIYQTHIANTEIQIKECFEFHLNKCKNSTQTNQETKEELSESVQEAEENKIYVIKKSKKIISSDDDLTNLEEELEKKINSNKFKYDKKEKKNKSTVNKN